jgi:quercetin dioxygenase-like cupin family protein
VKTTTITAALVLLGATAAGAQAPAAPNEHGSMIQHDAELAKEEPGTHGGGGMSTGYDFFGGAPGLTTVFRKRALHPGAGIGYHLHRDDEIYYVLSGRGEYTLDGVKQEVGPGAALLTRAGSSHGMKVLGDQDLVLVITYQQAPKVTK